MHLIWILSTIYPRTTLRHALIELVLRWIHPLLGIEAHLTRKLGIPPWLVGVRSGIPALLGGIESSCERDRTDILSSPGSINAPRLVPTGLSSQRSVSSTYAGLLI